MRHLITACLAAAALTTPALASANQYDITKDEGVDYTVEFFVDTLSGNGHEALDDTIRVRPNGVRRTLIRPRTNFVRSLVRSVEEM